MHAGKIRKLPNRGDAASGAPRLRDDRRGTACRKTAGSGAGTLQVGWAALWVGLSVLLLALYAGGCAYSFSGSSLPGHLRTIAVPIFENETLDALIADEVTQGLIEGFLDDNRLKIARETQADCVLEGTVTYYERKVYSYTPDEVPEQYIVSVTVSAVLKDRVKNADVWTNERLNATATYAATPSGSPDVIDSEDEAREAAISQLTQDVLARTLEQW